MDRLREAAWLLDTAYRAMQLAQRLSPGCLDTLKERLIMSTTTDKVRQLIQQVSTLVSSNAALQAQVAAKDTQITTLTTQLDDKTTEVATLTAQVSQLTTAVSTLQAQQVSLTASIDTVQQASDAKDAALATANDTIAAKNIQIAELQASSLDTALAQEVDDALDAIQGQP